MYPLKELVGYGTLLQYKNPLNEVWTTVAGTKNLEFPNDTTDDIETTDNSSGGYRTYLPNPLSGLEDADGGNEIPVVAVARYCGR